MMNGFINVLKPSGMTSSDAVLAVRKLLPRKTPVGHGGTLDPDAAGVLPVCVGKATRLFDYIIDKQKTYIGELCLGVTTETDDASGAVLEVREVNVSDSEVEKVLHEFVGDVSQVPPMYSALKRGGEPLYKLARRGDKVELDARIVHIDSVKLIRKTGNGRFLLEIRCGKGVYIRSLMRDIGDRLGCGGHMSFLLRSAAGVFSVENGHAIEELRAGDIENFLVPMDQLLGAYRSVYVPGEMRRSIINGQPVKKCYAADCITGEIVKLYVAEEFAGMGIVNDEGGITIKCMLLEIQEKV